MGRFDPLRVAFDRERRAAAEARRLGGRAQEWSHLERAHIVGQPSARLHLHSHVLMLAFALRQRDGREVAGQLLRLVVAGPGSLSGRYPVGNTGGARVPATQPMAVPDDLRQLLAPYRPAAAGSTAAPPPR